MSISSLQFLLVHVFFLILNSSFAQRPIFPNSIVLPVDKDAKTLQYVTKLHLGQALFSTSLVLDVGGQFMWVDSSALPSTISKNPIFCSSLQCSMAKTNACGTGDLGRKICSLETLNSITKVGEFGDLVEDDIDVKFRDGSNSGASVTIHDFLFSYTHNMLDGLASGVKGILGIGNSRVALPSQLSTRFGFQRKFALCLSSSNGVLLAGDGRYVNNMSRSLVYTPLIGSEYTEYFINVKSIKINGMKLDLNSSNLVLDKEGNGGTTISTILPYSTLRGSIYDEVMCLGFLNGGKNQKASIVIGGHQLEENLMEFDLGTSMLGFVSLVNGKQRGSCSDFSLHKPMAI